jgi:hypothetical protein
VTELQACATTRHEKGIWCQKKQHHSTMASFLSLVGAGLGWDVGGGADTPALHCSTSAALDTLTH